MSETILQSKNREAFLAFVDEKRACTWQWALGIEFICSKQSLGWELTLNIQRQTQRPDLFAETLKRRFEGVELYEHCFICLNSQLTFVIWHELHNEHQREQVSELIYLLLSLSGQSVDGNNHSARRYLR